MYTHLIVAGWLLTFVVLALIIVPWWIGRTQLVSYWNFFLLGTINFITLGMVQNARGMSAAGGWAEGEFGRESWIFLWAVLVFWSLASIVYFWPRRSTPPKPVRFTPWPADNAWTIGSAAVLLSTLGFFISFIPPFPGVQFLYIANGPMTIAGFFLSIVLVWRSPSNPVVWIILLVATTFGSVGALGSGGGRRELLSLFCAIPVAAYWIYLRTQRPAKTMLWLAAIGMAGMIVIGGYSTFRHQDRDSTAGVTRAQTRLQKLPQGIADKIKNFKLLGSEDALLDAQNGVWTSLLTIQLTHTQQTIETDPFHCARFILTNPIPRAIWPTKPIGLGKIIPLEMGNPRITWGPTVIGHCFYDGGWLPLIIYALIFGVAFRWLDERMYHDPSNPWLMAAMTSVAGHFLGLARGDCGTFIANIIAGLIVISLAVQPLRFFFGRRIAQSTDPTPPPPHSTPIASY